MMIYTRCARDLIVMLSIAAVIEYVHARLVGRGFSETYAASGFAAGAFFYALVQMERIKSRINEQRS
jgi:hypothetical protein